MTERRGSAWLARCLLVLMLLSAANRAHGQAMVTDAGSPAPSFMAPLSMPGLQPFWLGYVGADRGLGYQGQYFSAGGLIPITTDMLNGTWFVDGRGHVTANYGNFFSNIGIGRRSYITGNTILGVSGWYDYDGDAYQNYGYRYNQLGVTGEIFNPISDFRVNGYWPVGKTAHVLDEFTQHYLLYQNGIDTALHGADMKFSVRPPFMGVWNGYIDIGGYLYRSSVTSQVGGVSSGFGVSPIPGLAINLEVNHDNLFGTTGFVRVAFGLRGTPGNSRTGNRLLEPTRRNDHIVRFNQQPEIATNPQTGSAYNVVHVDNTAPPGGDGTAEHPFRTLAQAQAASAPFDMIYVHRGDGTAHGYNMGITLQNNQMLFGSGDEYLVQTTEIGPFLMHALTQTGPVITNPAGAAVTLANDDRVGGMTISGAQYGIVGNSITNMSMESNRIINSGVDGVFLTNFSGLAHIRHNTITDNLEDGIHVFGGLGAYDVRGNTIEANIRNGVFFDGALGAAVVDSNVLGENGRGNWGGLHVIADSGNFNVEASDNLIQGNTEGIILEAYNAGNELTATIHHNRAIQYNLGDGIQVKAQDGAVVNFAILNNPDINYNGGLQGGGAGIRMYASDGVLSGTISYNTILANAGVSTPVVTQAAGIQGQFDGNSITGLRMIGNTINGQSVMTTNPVPPITAIGDGVQLLYNLNNTVVQTLYMEDNTIINSRGDGVIILAEPSSLFIPGLPPVFVPNTSVLDATLYHNTISGNYLRGLDVEVSDQAVFRVTATNNTITDNLSPFSPQVDRGGVFLRSDSAEISSPSRLIGIFTNNVISNNGVFRTLIGTPTTTNGLGAATSGVGEMALQIFGNQINGNGNRGIDFEADNASTLVAQIHDNMIQSNRGDSSLHALTPSETPPNASLIAIDLTHNETTKQFTLQNLQNPPDSALIVWADGGLNSSSVNPIGPGSVFQVPVGTVTSLIAPLLVFP